MVVEIVVVCSVGGRCVGGLGDSVRSDVLVGKVGVGFVGSCVVGITTKLNIPICL